jgi:protein transport protein SEC31
MNQNISSDITSVGWNRKVIHVLATTTYSGTTIIWDLRAKKPAVTFADPSRRNKCKAIAWSPEQPTIIATSSEEDDNPVVQLWDLTNAFSPVKVRFDLRFNQPFLVSLVADSLLLVYCLQTLHGHSRGVLALSWCPFDSSLLLSSGKDGRSLCWDTTAGDVLCELEPAGNSIFEAQWSPTMPTMASTCSHDGKVCFFFFFFFFLFVANAPSPRHMVNAFVPLLFDAIDSHSLRDGL